MTTNQVKLIIGVIGLILLFSFGTSMFYVVEPGYRGVAITMGNVDQTAKKEGLGFKLPWTSIVQIEVRQKTVEHSTLVFSKDQQELKVHFKVFYKPNENKVVELYQKYSGDPFKSLILPRVEESLKEQTVALEAVQILNDREKVKLKALEGALKKTEKLVDIEDMSLVDIDFSPQLKEAIEAKMVASQNAQKAQFAKQQAQVEAETALIKAQGEANAIKVQGQALKENPQVVQLEIVRKWNGVPPSTVVNGNSGSVLLPIK